MVGFPSFLISQVFPIFLSGNKPQSSHELATDAVYFRQHDLFTPWCIARNRAFQLADHRTPGRCQTDGCPDFFSGGLRQRHSERGRDPLGATTTFSSLDQNSDPLLFLQRKNSIAVVDGNWVPASSFAWWGWSRVPSLPLSSLTWQSPTAHPEKKLLIIIHTQLSPNTLSED